MSLNSDPKSEKNEYGFNGFISLGRACCYSTDPKLLNIYINTFETPFLLRCLLLNRVIARQNIPNWIKKKNVNSRETNLFWKLLQSKHWRLRVRRFTENTIATVWSGPSLFGDIVKLPSIL